MINSCYFDDPIICANMMPLNKISYMKKGNNIMEKIGELINLFRENKGMSQAELSDGILSKAQLSKFERDLTIISVDKFLALLERLHVTLAEFGNALVIQENLYEQSILEDITKAVINNNKDQAQLVKERAEQHLKKHPGKYNQLTLIMVKAMIFDMEKETLPKADTKVLADYLFSVDGWTHFELLLFGNTMSSLPLVTVNQLARELASQINEAWEIHQNFQLNINLLYNVVILNLSAKDLTTARLFLRVMKHSHVEDSMMAERYLIALADALCVYCGEPTGEHENHVNRIIEVQKEIGSTNFFVAFKNQAKMFINETKTSNNDSAGNI
jgi:HTH-type transcriptional regulator, SHP2-responsive activator